MQEVGHLCFLIERDVSFWRCGARMWHVMRAVVQDLLTALVMGRLEIGIGIAIAEVSGVFLFVHAL